MSKTNLIIIILVIVALVAGLASRLMKDKSTEMPPLNDAEKEEGMGEELGYVEHNDLIRVTSPLPESQVSSPLVITGKARGMWYFEADFPITLTNWDGLIIAEGYATAQGDWMTEEYVPFTATLEFVADTSVSNRGTLILHKDNPSGLPERDDALEYTVYFAD